MRKKFIYRRRQVFRKVIIYVVLSHLHVPGAHSQFSHSHALLPHPLPRLIEKET